MKKPALPIEARVEDTPPIIADHESAHAERFMLGDLIKAATRQFKDLALPFNALDQESQEVVLTKVADDVHAAVLKAISIIKNHGRVEFRAEVSEVKFKGTMDVSAQLKMTSHSGAHDLADYAGRYVTIVIDDISELMAEGDSTTGAPNQPDLLED